MARKSKHKYHRLISNLLISDLEMLRPKLRLGDLYITQQDLKPTLEALFNYPHDRVTAKDIFKNVWERKKRETECIAIDEDILLRYDNEVRTGGSGYAWLEYNCYPHGIVRKNCRFMLASPEEIAHIKTRFFPYAKPLKNINTATDVVYTAAKQVSITKELAMSDETKEIEVKQFQESIELEEPNELKYCEALVQDWINHLKKCVDNRVIISDQKFERFKKVYATYSPVLVEINNQNQNVKIKSSMDLY